MVQLSLCVRVRKVAYSHIHYLTPSEKKMMMLQRWAVREHFVSGAYL